MPVTEILDIDSSKPWESITITRDPVGVLQSRFVEYDDNSTRLYEFNDDGSLASYTLTPAFDDPTPPGFPRPEVTVEKNFESLTINYDFSGRIADQILTGLDGVVDTSFFSSNGSVFGRTIEDVNNAYTYTEKQFQYAEDGSIIFKNVFYDDGTSYNINTFDFDGEIINVERRTDAQEAGGFFNWSQIETATDDSGNVLYKTVFYDGGLIVETGVTDNNGLQYTDTIDAVPFPFIESPFDLEKSDAFNWNSITKVFDTDGDMQGRLISMDNDDAFISVWDGGVRQSQLIFDGDDSNAWEFRFVTYDAAGAITSAEVFEDFEALSETVDLNAIVTAFDFNSLQDLIDFITPELPPEVLG